MNSSARYLYVLVWTMKVWLYELGTMNSMYEVWICDELWIGDELYVQWNKWYVNF